MRELTKRQQEVLEFIAGYVRANAYSPTIREVADFFSISVKGAHDHLVALKKKGHLKQGDNKPRTMGLVKPAEDQQDFREIPILGTVAAGRPIFSVENMDGVIKFDRSQLKNGRDYFAVRVRGDSMEDAGIMDGDTAIIESQNTARNGEIAVVMLDDEAYTLKTFYRENTRIRLQPENCNYQPIYCTGDVRVVGRLAHILRSYT
ncbi:MAG: transcriptional repressor LexA [Treponema sp.]|nr:transcriptional repressor LexA [Treponema sp.]